MQEYFKTGKTIVIDDQYNEAKPLLDALSKNQIPFFYTQGKPNSDYPLPNTDPNESQHYNLVFLDLNLDFKFAGSQIVGNAEEKTFKGTHAQILNTILRNKNRSFILVIWSNEEENFLPYFKQLFDDDKYTKKRPYKIITLAKSNFFSLTQNGYEFKKDESGNIKPHEEKLFQEIGNALKQLEGFKLFCEWDKVVAQSVSDTVDDFMSLANHISEDAKREEYIAKILTLISISYAGWDGFLNYTTDEEKTDSFMLAMTQILNDDIDRNVLHERQQEFKNWKAGSREDIKNLYKEITPSLLNKKLLICYANQKALTGSVYQIGSWPDELDRVLSDCIEYGSAFKVAVEAYKIKYKPGFEKKNKLLDASSAGFKLFLASRFIPIEVNVTPLCDIVQGKHINHRILKGFLAPSVYKDCIKNDLAFFAESPVFNFNNNEVFIGLDLRSFSSCSADDIGLKDYMFSIRSNLMNDIQTKLAAHVSRLGVLYL